MTSMVLFPGQFRGHGEVIGWVVPVFLRVVDRGIGHFEVRGMQNEINPRTGFAAFESVKARLVRRSLFMNLAIRIEEERGCTILASQRFVRRSIFRRV